MCPSQDLRNAAAAPDSVLQIAMQSSAGPEYLADASALSRAGLKGAECRARSEHLGPVTGLGEQISAMACSRDLGSK